MTRYAIYYAPAAESPLARYGSAVLGYDLATGGDVEPPYHPVFRDPAALGWTAVPRRYGFHATLKAPMHLAEHRTARELEEALVAFARTQAAFPVTMTLAPVGHFLALVLVEPVPAMERLAASCVTAFDLFRAPLTPEDRERRHPDRMIEAQVEMLDRWGYPFVLDQFQFHMTLTSDLEPKDRAVLEPVLRDLLAGVPLTVPVDSVVLCRQEGPNERFVLQRRFAFGG